MPNDSLEGVRVWLSGSIPDDTSPDEKKRIRDFVTALAAELFGRNGRLVHGSHPTITEPLIEAAKAYHNDTKRKAGLVLAVSRLYSKDPAPHGIKIDEWNAVCAEKVIETRRAGRTGYG